MGRFDGGQAQFQGQTATFERRGDEFWVVFRDLYGIDDFEEQVVMTTGSHHMQVYLISTGNGRELAMVPFVFLLTGWSVSSSTPNIL